MDKKILTAEIEIAKGNFIYEFENMKTAMGMGSSSSLIEELQRRTANAANIYTALRLMGEVKT